MGGEAASFLVQQSIDDWAATVVDSSVDCYLGAATVVDSSVDCYLGASNSGLLS